MIIIFKGFLQPDSCGWNWSWQLPQELPHHLCKILIILIILIQIVMMIIIILVFKLKIIRNTNTKLSHDDNLHPARRQLCCDHQLHLQLHLQTNSWGTLIIMMTNMM